MANKAQLGLATSFTSFPATVGHRFRAPVTEASLLFLRLPRHTHSCSLSIHMACFLVSTWGFCFSVSSERPSSFQKSALVFTGHVPLPDLSCWSRPYSLSHCLLTAVSFCFFSLLYLFPGLRIGPGSLQALRKCLLNEWMKAGVGPLKCYQTSSRMYTCIQIITSVIVIYISLGLSSWHSISYTWSNLSWIAVLWNSYWYILF